MLGLLLLYMKGEKLESNQTLLTISTDAFLEMRRAEGENLTAYARNRKPASDTIQEQKSKRNQYLASDLLILKCINQCAKHYSTSTFPPSFSICS